MQDLITIQKKSVKVMFKHFYNSEKYNKQKWHETCHKYGVLRRKVTEPTAAFIFCGSVKWENLYGQLRENFFFIVLLCFSAAVFDVLFPSPAFNLTADLTNN